VAIITLRQTKKQATKKPKKPAKKLSPPERPPLMNPSSDPKKPTFSYTGLCDYMRCPWLYMAKHEWFIEPASSSEALMFGRAVHQGLASYGLYRDLDTALHSMDSLLPLQLESGGHRDRLLAYRVVSDYIATNGYRIENMSGVEITGIHEFDNFNLVAVIDGIIPNSNGSVTVVEHKTSSMKTDKYLAGFLVSWQVSAYVAAAQKLGFPCKNCYLNVMFIGHPTKKEGVRIEFFPLALTRTKDELSQWERNLSWWAARIADSKANQVWPTSDSCYAGVPGRPFECDFLTLCQAGCKTKEAALRLGFKEREKWWE